MASAIVLAALCMGQVASAFRPDAETEPFLSYEDSQVSFESHAQLQSALAQTGVARPGGPCQVASNLEVEKEEKLGEGAGGEVWKCKVTCDTKDGECREVALKQPRASSTPNKGAFEKEAAILTYLKGKSEYVLSIVGAYVWDEQDCIITELMNQGELHGFLFDETDVPQEMDEQQEMADLSRDDSWRSKRTVSQTATFFWQLAKGLADIHESGIVHRDIKLQNVFVNCQEGSDTLCFAAHGDFGSSELVNETDVLIAGSWYYMAPEVQYGDKEARCIPANDLWSMGVLMHGMFLHELPSKPRSPRLLAKGLQDKGWMSSEVSDKVVEILNLTLEEDHTLRIDANRLLAKAEELLKMIASPEDLDRVTKQSPTSYGARQPIPECLDGEAPMTWEDLTATLAKPIKEPSRKDVKKQEPPTGCFAWPLFKRLW